MTPDPALLIQWIVESLLALVVLAGLVVVIWNYFHEVDR